MLAKLKWLFLIGTVVLAFPADDSTNSDKLEILRQFIKDRCLANADEEHFEELKNTTANFESCWKDKIETPKNKSEKAVMICTVVVPAFYDCLENLVLKADHCLNPEEKYLVGFVLNTYNSSVDQQCKDDGKQMQVILDKANNEWCDLPSRKLQGLISEKCVPNLLTVQNFDKPDFVLRKSDLCGDLLTFNECIKDTIEKSCEGSAYYKFAKISMAPYLEWCDKNSADENIIE